MTEFIKAMEKALKSLNQTTKNYWQQLSIRIADRPNLNNRLTDPGLPVAQNSSYGESGDLGD